MSEKVIRATKRERKPKADATTTLPQEQQIDDLLRVVDPEQSETLYKLSRFCRVERIQINRPQLKNAPYNPRTITPTGSVNLRGSISDFGLVQDPIWNSRSGNVVGGHQRVNELDRLEGTPNYSLFVYKVDLDERQEKNLNLILNNLAAQGEHDKAKVVEMYVNNEFDLDLTGYRPLDMEMFALDAGLPTNFIDSQWTPEAASILDGMTGHINEVLDQSDELKRRKAEDAKRNGNGKSGSGPAAQRKQSQDEDEDGESGNCRVDDDLENAERGGSSLIDSSRIASNNSHAHSANGQPLTPEKLALLKAGAGNANTNANASSNSSHRSAPVKGSPEYYREAKTKLSEAMLAQRDTDVMVTLVFISSEHKRAFCNAVGIHEMEVLMDGPTVAEMAGIKLPEILKPERRNAIARAKLGDTDGGEIADAGNI